MIRVLHVVGGLNVGGTETWLAKGLPFVDRERYQFDFLVHGEGPQHYKDEMQAGGARVLNGPRSRRLLAYAHCLWKILKTNEYQVVHAHTYCFSGFVLAVAAFAGVPVRVFQSHTAQDESERRGLRRFYFRLSRRLIRGFSTVGVAVSEEAAAPMFPRNWRRNPERWRVSPIGIDLAPFATDVDSATVRSELAIPAEAKVFIHVGRFVPVKNHELLVKAAREMLRKETRMVWLLVGDGPGRAGIEKQVEELDMAANFRFVGVRSDVPRLLQASDVFVLPSFYEGFPLSYLEAQAAGLPCVISDVIARSAELVPGHTLRCPVQGLPEIWAEALLRAADIGRANPVPREMAPVSIERSMQRMVECYR